MRHFTNVMKVIVVAAVLSVTSLTFAEQTRVQYSIEITDAAHHLAEVTVLFPESTSSAVDFVMPAWRLGKYQILNLANGLRNVTVTDAKGNQLDVHKTDKNTWHVELKEPSKLAFSYQLYADELSKRTRHIDDTHAFLDGLSSFIYSPEFIDTALEVKLDVPSGWRSESGMQRTGKHSFKADNYAVLASSPIESGKHEYYSFSQKGKKYEVVIWGVGNFDGKKIVDDYKKMVVEHGKLWGNYPFKRYLFIIHAFPGAGGATEHINSTVIHQDALGFSDKKSYARFLSTSSHEFVHTWNVKAYRPVGIANYDYTRENYSDLLWISEGSTSYFGDILLVRAGLLTTNNYLEKLASKVQRYLNRPGRKVMSAQQSSFDTWIEVGGDRALNSSVNIYSKGELLSLLMDIDLLKDTGAGSGYADLHRLLFERFPVSHKGFSSVDIQDFLAEISGKDYTKFWNDYVESTAVINFRELFKVIGLELTNSNKETSSKKPEEPKKTKLWIGFSYRNTDSGLVLRSVLNDSPAWKAGLAPKDQLIAINGLKVTEKQFDALMSKFKKGDEIKVTVFRQNVLKDMTLLLDKIEPEKLRLVPMTDATDLQKNTFKKWLGVDFPSVEGTSLEGTSLEGKSAE